MKASPWLVNAPGRQRPQRLYCFSHAGGGAAEFRAWQALVGDQIEICAIELPGHGVRRMEQPAASLSYLVGAISLEIARQEHPAFSFFGHSLGALLAFEVTRHLMRHHMPLPRQLFVSGCTAPQRRRPSRGLHCMSDDDLIGELGAYNGTPPELLAHRELMEMVLPTLRADFALAENYVYAEGAPLSMPLTAMAGSEDPHVTSEEIDGWALEGGAPFESIWFEGDHFYLNPQREGVVELVKAALLPTQAHAQ